MQRCRCKIWSQFDSWCGGRCFVVCKKKQKHTHIHTHTHKGLKSGRCCLILQEGFVCQFFFLFCPEMLMTPKGWKMPNQPTHLKLQTNQHTWSCKTNQHTWSCKTATFHWEKFWKIPNQKKQTPEDDASGIFPAVTCLWATTEEWGLNLLAAWCGTDLNRKPQLCWNRRPSHERQQPRHVLLVVSAGLPRW